MKKTIKELEQLLLMNKEIANELLIEIEQDERIGVQKAYTKWLNNKQKKLELIKQFKQMSQFEEQLRQNGAKYIAGVDEVGRVI